MPLKLLQQQRQKQLLKPLAERASFSWQSGLVLVRNEKGPSALLLFSLYFFHAVKNTVRDKTRDIILFFCPGMRKIRNQIVRTVSPILTNLNNCKGC